MIKSTWPEKRPPLTDIINVLYEQNTEDTTIDKTENTIVETKTDSSYISRSFKMTLVLTFTYS